MNTRKALSAIGAGITTVLLVSVLVIELLNVEFSAIVGLPVGLLAGILVAVGLWVSLDETSLGVRRAVSAYATFGLAVLVLFAFRYVNIGRSVLTIEVIAGGSLAAVVVVYVVLYLYDRN